MRALIEIDAEISSCYSRLREVKGTKTEVYTRIVGYYRNMDHFNQGKKSELRDRITFKLPGVAGETIKE
jgi:hypothetical protein